MHELSFGTQRDLIELLVEASSSSPTGLPRGWVLDPYGAH